MAAADNDHLTGWSVQQGGVPDAPETVPGNVVTYDELPFRDSLKESGVDEDQYLAGLVIAVDEEEKRAIRGEDERAKGSENKDEKVADADKPKRSAEDRKDADEVAAKGAPADEVADKSKADAAKDEAAKDEAAKPVAKPRASAKA